MLIVKISSRYTLRYTSYYCQGFIILHGTLIIRICCTLFNVTRLYFSEIHLYFSHLLGNIFCVISNLLLPLNYYKKGKV